MIREDEYESFSIDYFGDLGMNAKICGTHPFRAESAKDVSTSNASSRQFLMRNSTWTTHSDPEIIFTHRGTSWLMPFPSLKLAIQCGCGTFKRILYCVTKRKMHMPRPVFRRTPIWPQPRCKPEIADEESIGVSSTGSEVV